MDSVHQMIINLNHEILTEKTVNIELVVDRLAEKNTITASCAQAIKSKKDPKDQANDLYHLIPKCGPWAYRDLVDTLLETENQTAAFFLKENRMCNQSPTEGLSPVEEPDEFFEENYRMKSTPRGYVLLINVFNYDHDWREQRDGSLKDVEDLERLFTEMGYKVAHAPDGTKEGIEDSIKAWKDARIMAEVDCGIIVLMAHGTEVNAGAVLVETSDRKVIETEWIISLMSSSEARRLHGKPKLIFILTCRGKILDMGTDMNRLQELQDAANQNGTQQLEASAFDTNGRFEGYAPVSPHLSDVLVIYPCAPGKASVRDVQKGSWFAQELINVFRQKAHIDDVETMLKETVCCTSRGFKRKMYLNPVSSFSRQLTSNGNSAASGTSATSG